MNDDLIGWEISAIIIIAIGMFVSSVGLYMRADKNRQDLILARTQLTCIKAAVTSDDFVKCSTIK